MRTDADPALHPAADGPTQTGAGTQTAPPSAERLTMVERLVLVGLFYVGVSAAIPQYVSIQVARLSPGLIGAGVLAAIGWRRMTWRPEMKRYLRWGVPLAIWIIISAIAAWFLDPILQGTVFVIWTVFLVPGLASLMRRTSYRHAMLGGWAAGTGVYVLVALSRVAGGHSVFDPIAGGGVILYLKGENRIVVDIIALVILPYLIAGDCGRRLQKVRWPLAVGIGWWVILSGGRSGLLGMGVVLLVYALVQPDLSQRVQRLVVLGLIAVIAMIAISALGGQASGSTLRLTSFFHGERTDADAARELLLRKAWHLADEHPAFGVGMGQFATTYDPIVEEARSLHVRHIAENWPEHNTFASAMAETGYPGMLFFIGVYATILLAGVRHLRDRASRAAVASVAGQVVGIFFMIVNGPRLFLPIALLLAAVLGDTPVLSSTETLSA